MRALLKNGIGVFSPQGFLDGNNGGVFLSIEDIVATTKLDANMILVSLNKVIFFNRNGLDMFVKMFKKIKENKRIIVGFCDYDLKKYNAIHNFYKNDLNFSLFATQDIAELFTSNFKNEKKMFSYTMKINLNALLWQ